MIEWPSWKKCKKSRQVESKTVFHGKEMDLSDDESGQYVQNVEMASEKELEMELCKSVIEIQHD